MSEQHKFVYDADGVPFTIYQQDKLGKSGPKTYWLLADTSTGKRRILNHTSRKAAERRADQIRAAMVKGQAHRQLLSNGQWQEVCMAVEILRSIGMEYSIRTAVSSWAECMAMLGDRATLLDAVKFFLANHQGSGPQLQPIRFDEAAKLYHGYKAAERKSAQHLKNIFSRLVNQLPKKLPPGVMLNALTAGQLEAAVVSLGLHPKTRNEYKILLGNFYHWAAKQNPPLVPKGLNPGREMERVAVVQREVSFLNVADLKRILTGLQTKRPDLLPLVALVCFAGLRPSEAARLDWNEIGDDYIRLPGSKSKTGRNRQIPIQKNLKAWLSQWRQNSGLICPGVSLFHVNPAIWRASGVRLDHDGLRHGYGTHRQRIISNVGSVAEEMGHSVAICRRHYLNAFCTEEEAAEWFNIQPESTDLVRSQPGAGCATGTTIAGQLVAA